MINDMLVSPAQRRRAQEFAELLEGRRHAAEHELQPLVQLATTLRPAHLEPSPGFSAALRQRLVEEAARRDGAGVATSPGRRAPRPVRRQPRVRQAVAGAAVTALIAGTGAAVASTRALPGDALYEVKRGLESAQLSLAGSDLTRGRELLEQADHRLSEAEALVSSGTASDAQTRARIGQALDDMQDALTRGAQALNRAYSSSGDAKAMTVLNRFAAERQDRLETLLARLDRLVPPATALQRHAEEIAAMLDELRGGTAALLPAGATAAESPAGGRARVSTGDASGDGWAGTRIAAAEDGYSPSRSSGSSTASPGSQAGGGGTTSSEPGGGSKLVDDVTGSLAKAGGKVGPSAGPSAFSVPSVGVPLPTVAVPPPGGGGGTGGLDLPCMPVAPLTTC